jgi:hypothetical protein
VSHAGCALHGIAVSCVDQLEQLRSQFMECCADALIAWMDFDACLLHSIIMYTAISSKAVKKGREQWVLSTKKHDLQLHRLSPISASPTAWN